MPEKYKSGRNLYEWNPAITLMRTTVEENAAMGKIFAEKANAATGPIAFLLPLRGVSILDGEGERFCDREADAALFNALKENLNPSIAVEEVDAAEEEDAAAVASTQAETAAKVDAAAPLPPGVHHDYLRLVSVHLNPCPFAPF